MTLGGRLLQPGTPAAIGSLAGRVSGLERQTRGHLIYVGTYPTDPNTTPESPPFQNGWANVGGNYPPLAFLMGVDGFVRIEGSCDSGTDGTVVFTLPEGYRPDQSQRFVCALSSGSDFMTLQIDPTGDVIVVARGFAPGSGSIAAGTVAPATTNGWVLTTVGGVAQWAAPAPTAPSSLNVKIEGTTVGAEGTVNLHQGSVVSIAGTDNTTSGEVELTIGVVAGGEGQVLTTVSGVAAWHDAITPTPPAAQYPVIEAAGTTLGSEATINFVGQNVVSVTGHDTSGVVVEVDIGLAPGGEGQVVQTVGGVPAWSDLVVAKTLQMEFFGALPAVTGPTQAMRVPFVKGASRTFNLDRIFARVETAGASPTTVQIERSSSTTGFVPTVIGTVTIAPGDNEAETTASLGTVTSGDLVRADFTALGAGAASFYIEFEGTEEV